MVPAAALPGWKAVPSPGGHGSAFPAPLCPGPWGPRSSLAPPPGPWLPCPESGVPGGLRTRGWAGAERLRPAGARGLRDYVRPPAALRPTFRSNCCLAERSSRGMRGPGTPGASALPPGPAAHPPAGRARTDFAGTLGSLGAA
ncbi:U1 small nuclear ribonucleoprotein C-like [Dipodomys spectabilis]|uniref:U1 small nuclear ribonucleoprotein C-like n=1 Tax=Dipodomys spectabilis TaxID=105255 RepID=UPI001C54B255|nr:U1 small nuclear ribonucleoprotein C-like [Dipodomys spectabilis]